MFNTDVLKEDAINVPFEKIVHWGNVYLSGHAIAQLRRHTTSEVF